MNPSRLSLYTVVLMVLAIVGCSSDHPDQTKQAEKQVESNLPAITITDAADRTLTIERPVDRVAILDNGTGEILEALGVTDRIVGNHQTLEHNELYPGLEGVPVVATNAEVNYEKLAEVAPQVVISSVRAHGVVSEQENLQNFHITDIKMNLRNPKLMKEEVLLLGKIFDREEKAQEIVNFYTKYEREIAARIESVKEGDRPRIFVEYHAGDFKTGAPGSRFYEQTVLAGANNIASGLSGEPQVSDEWVAENDIDVFLREASGLGYSVDSYDFAKSIRDEIMSRPALAKTAAVRNGAVFVISVDLYSRPGYIVGISYLAKWLYPDLFADFNPEQVHKEYMALFHPGMALKGVWTYTGAEGK